MNMKKEIEKILEPYYGKLASVLGETFLYDSFLQNFRENVGLQDDKAFLVAFRDFMAVADEIFQWGDYLVARTTAEKAFRIFYEKQHFPPEAEDIYADEFILYFFNEVIDENVALWLTQHPGQEYDETAPAIDDVNTVQFAGVLTLAALYGQPDDKDFCAAIGIQYDFEQLHMCDWFSSQITNGGGQYSRTETNNSARTAYNRLRNPQSLLWIGVVMGVDREVLRAAAAEMEEKKNNAAKCSIVRKHVPFDRVFAGYQNALKELERE